MLTAAMQVTSRASLAFERGLGICVFLFLPILVLSPKGVAGLLAIAALCALGLCAPRYIEAWCRVRDLALLFGALLLWGLLSSSWAVQPERSLVMVVRLAGLFAAGLALIAATGEVGAPKRMMSYLLAGFVVALMLTLAQLGSNGALTAPFFQRGFIKPGLNNIEDGFSLLLLPLCAALISRGRRLAAVLLAAATLGVTCVLVGEIARLALALGIAATMPFYLWRVGLTRVAALVSVVLILAAPATLPRLSGIDAVHNAAYHFKSSLWHRLEIWSFVGDRIAEKPLFGWGLDSSRAIPGGHAPIPEGLPGQESLPLHPHNVPLQLWVELGIPGAVWLAVVLARLWLTLGRVLWSRLYIAAAAGSLVTWLVVELGSYGAWEEWWIATALLTLFLIAVLARVATK